jgi:hypothetical protein
MMLGCLLGSFAYFFIYRGITWAVGAQQPAVIVALIVAQIVIAALITGPIAAFLVQSFPARVRYTSMSLPYHFGNGWFGGFLPLIATALVARTGNMYAGLIYPSIVALMTFVVGSITLRETRHHRIWDEV